MSLRRYEHCYNFYNTSHDMPNKLRLEKNELKDLKIFRSHRKAPLNLLGSNWVLVAEK